MLLTGTDGGAVEIVGHACLGSELKGWDWSPCGYKGIAYAMTEVGGIGEGVGHGTLVGIEATVVAVGMEILTPGIYMPFACVITYVLCEHIALGNGGRRR